MTSTVKFGKIKQKLSKRQMNVINQEEIFCFKLGESWKMHVDLCVYKCSWNSVML
jgi:hypothetical protein